MKRNCINWFSEEKWNTPNISALKPSWWLKVCFSSNWVFYFFVYSFFKGFSISMWRNELGRMWGECSSKAKRKKRLFLERERFKYLLLFQRVSPTSFLRHYQLEKVGWEGILFTLSFLNFFANILFKESPPPFIPKITKGDMDVSLFDKRVWFFLFC